MTVKENILKELAEKKDIVSMVIYGHIYKNCKILETDNLFTKVEVNDIDERFIDHSMVLESKLVLNLPNIDFSLTTNHFNTDNYFQYWCFLNDFMKKTVTKPKNITNNTERKVYRPVTQQKDPQNKIINEANNEKVNDKKSFNNYLKNENIKDSDNTLNNYKVFNDVESAMGYIFNELSKEIDNNKSEEKNECNCDCCNNSKKVKDTKDDEEEFKAILRAMEEFGKWIED